MKEQLLTEDTRESISSQVNIHLQWGVALLLDAVFFVVWLLLQKLVSWLIGLLALQNDPETQKFQFMFSWSTLIAIAAFFIKDLAIVIIRSWKAIKREATSEKAKA